MYFEQGFLPGNLMETFSQDFLPFPRLITIFEAWKLRNSTNGNI